MQLPNLLIIGAAKAGTTTLYDLLIGHKKVYMSFVKEPMFFSRDAYFQRGLQWYAQTFFANSEAYPVRGEATPHYLYWAEKVAPRIRESMPDAPIKFIVILRDPVERAYSWYWNMIKEGEEDLSFEDALAREPERLESNDGDLRSKGSMIFGYQKGGMYARQIKEFLKVFPRESFHFLLQDDLRSPQSEALTSLYGFLGFPANLVGDALAKRNPSTLPYSRTLQGWLRSQSRVKETAKRLLPFRFRYSLKKYLTDRNTRTFAYPEMNVHTRVELRGKFATEIAELQALLGRDLSHWLASGDKSSD